MLGYAKAMIPKCDDRWDIVRDEGGIDGQQGRCAMMRGTSVHEHVTVQWMADEQELRGIEAKVTVQLYTIKINA